MKLNELYPSKYLRATDIDTPIPVRIKEVTIEEFGGNKEQKPVVLFFDDVKPLILNKTNASALADITGFDDSDDWSGARIELYRAEIEMNGERKPAVRIRAVRSSGEEEEAVLSTR